MARGLTMLSVLAALGVAGCGGSKDSAGDSKATSIGASTNASGPPAPGDAAAVRASLADLRATAVARDANRICTQIFTRKLALQVRSTDKQRSCTRVMRRGFKATSKLRVLRVKVADADHATASVKDGLGSRGTIVLVKQSGRWRIDDLKTS
jgi:hypothetical protein